MGITTRKSWNAALISAACENCRGGMSVKITLRKIFLYGRMLMGD